MSQSGQYATGVIPPGDAILTITPNVGGPIGPTGGNINLLTSNSTAIFSGLGSTITLNFGISNLILGSNAASASGAENTGLGDLVLNSLTSGNANTGIGWSSLLMLNSGSNNTAVGEGSLIDLTTGSSNTAVGRLSLGSLLTGSSNIAIGASSGSAYVGAESGNILIGNAGVAAESDVIRIGSQGTQTKAFIAGITGVTVSNPSTVVINSVTGQLGVAAGGGSPIETITGNDGTPESPSAGNFNIVTANATVKFLGTAATENLNFGIVNLALGSSLSSLTSGVRNVSLGSTAMAAINTGSNNVGIGTATLLGNVTGSNNTAIGDNALINLASGSTNIAVGRNAGNNYTGAESNNIDIGNLGVASESNVLRIGVYGSGAGQQNKSYIAATYSNYGTQNTFVGEQSGNTTLTIGSALSNVGVGYQTLAGVTTGAANTTVGEGSMNAVAAGNHNTAIGNNALNLLTSGSDNSAIGDSTLQSLLTGSYNTVLGYDAGTAYTSSESSNILIGNVGVISESNVIRIGTQGSGSGQQNECFIAGVAGVSVSNLNVVTINTVTGQLGSQAASSGGISTITGNDGTPESPSAGNFNIVTNYTTAQFLGSAATETLSFNLDNILIGSPTTPTGAHNVSLGLNAMGVNVSGSRNTGIGYEALLSSGPALSGNDNTALGYLSLNQMTNGSSNTAVGSGTLQGAVSNSGNTAIGYKAMNAGGSTAGINNTALGNQALYQLSGAGAQNIAIGYLAASAYTGTENSNIIIGNVGIISEANVIRIGTQGSGTGQQDECFIAGIDGVNLSSANVVTEVSGQLGTAVITAGTGITISTATPNEIIISATGTTTLTYTSVTTTPYTVLSTDEFLGVTTSALAITIDLPNAPATGRVYTIKDVSGLASTNNITVTTVGGSVNIDGATSFVMNTNYQSINVLFNGTAYLIF